jgi:hypothetical protein
MAKNPRKIFSKMGSDMRHCFDFGKYQKLFFSNLLSPSVCGFGNIFKSGFFLKVCRGA